VEEEEEEEEVEEEEEKRPSSPFFPPSLTRRGIGIRCCIVPFPLYSRMKGRVIYALALHTRCPHGRKGGREGGW